MPTLDHEKLDVYRIAIDFAGHADSIVEGLPRGRAYLARQLQRASTSIALNIAEGAGEYSPRDKVRFYRIALRSATECAAILDVCQRFGLIKPDCRSRARDLIIRIVSMLTKMARKIDITEDGKRFPGTGSGTGTKRRNKQARE